MYMGNSTGCKMIQKPCYSTLKNSMVFVLINLCDCHVCCRQFTYFHIIILKNSNFRRYFIKYLCRCYGIDSYQTIRRNCDVTIKRWINLQELQKDQVFHKGKIELNGILKLRQ